MIHTLAFLSVLPDESLLYTGSYNTGWVFASIFLAIVASYAALIAAARADRQEGDIAKRLWSLLAVFTLGVGVWAMHFIGMLALNLPCGVYYDPFYTLISMIPGIIASWVALGFAWDRGRKHLPPMLASVLLGLGIGTMHYTGMSAMRLDGVVQYDPLLFALSLFVAIALAYLALRVKNGLTCLRRRCNVLVAVILGGAISGMHYTAMSAAYFVRGDASAQLDIHISTDAIALMIAIVTVSFAFGALALAAVSRNREIAEKLRVSEQMFRQLSENIRDVFWVTDASKEKMIYVSPAYEHIFGRNVRTLYDSPRSWMDAIHESDQARVQAAQTKQTLGGYDEEYRIVRPDGEIRWIRDEAFAVTDGSGAIYRIVGLAQDITERKGFEHNAELDQYSLDHAQDAIFRIDQAGRIRYVNAAACNHLGYTRDELLALHIDSFSEGMSSVRWREYWNSIEQTEQARFETRHKRKDGTIVPVEVASNMVEFDGESFSFATVRNIAERKRVERDLQQSNRALATLSAVNRNLVQASDEIELLQGVCRSIVEQCGYKLAWVGYLQHDAAKSIKPMAQYGYEEGYLEQAGIVWADAERGRGPTGRAARSAQTQIAQNILTDDSMLPWRANAIRRGYAASIAIPLIREGVVFGVLTLYAEQPDAFEQVEKELLEEMAADLVFGVHFLRAQQERNSAMAQLQATAAELEHANVQIEDERARLAERVIERTSELQLANHAKDAFLATMSHEIRTPLSGLLGMMELLALSNLMPGQTELLHAAQKSGNSLLRIVNDILDWSKIEAGKLALSPTATSLSQMLRSVSDTYTQLANEKDVALKLNIDAALVDEMYVCDALRVSQILNNFTSNAIKFTEHGSVQIGVERLMRQTDGDLLRFSVRDSGIGIATDNLQRLFQQYQQGSADIARMYGGTGLGLSICRRLAELMGGTLSVESELGVGSTFYLTISLPLEKNSVQVQTGSHPANAPQQERSISPLVVEGQHISILIVDDHPLNRMLLKQQLALLGLHVEAAVNGVQAISVFAREHFDLVITDCHMPEMDGYEFTHQLRDAERASEARRVPIIAWTANVLAEESARCYASGMDDILTKPTELHELRAVLLKWLIHAQVLKSPDA